MISLVTLLRSAAVALLLVLLQLVIGYIAVEDVTPDLLDIFAVFIALRDGQSTGLIGGFGVGHLFENIWSDVLGTGGRAKMIGAFVAGFFHDAQFTLQVAIGSFRCFGIVVLASVVHNMFSFFFGVQPTDLWFWSL